jgi:hypothetical protein
MRACMAETQHMLAKGAPAAGREEPAARRLPPLLPAALRRFLQYLSSWTAWSRHNITVVRSMCRAHGRGTSKGASGLCGAQVRWGEGAGPAADAGGAQAPRHREKSAKPGHCTEMLGEGVTATA